MNNVFSEFNGIKAIGTVDTYRHNLDVFCVYLAELGIKRTGEELQTSAEQSTGSV